MSKVMISLILSVVGFIVGWYIGKWRARASHRKKQTKLNNIYSQYTCGKIWSKK